MIVYAYSDTTGAYTGEDKADPCTLEEGVFLHPANTTPIKPPKPKKGETPVFNGDTWESVENNTGKEYWDQEGRGYIIQEIGEVMPDWALLEKPDLEQIRLDAKTHDDWRADGLRMVASLHAMRLARAAGTATTQEVLTWEAKVRAAHSVLSESDQVSDDIEALTNDVGDDPKALEALARTILAKNKAYKSLIGKAAKERREAKAAVIEATDPSVPIKTVAGLLEAIGEKFEKNTPDGVSVADL